MSSINTKFYTWMTAMTGNVNPIKRPNAVMKMKKMALHFTSDKVNKKYKLEKRTTSNGTKYELLYRKDIKKTRRVIYYIHGGAYVTGLISTYRKFNYVFCDLADDIAVCMLDYSLAPEYKFPIQLNEALDVWNEMIVKHKIKEEDIILGGDSAGGHLVLSTMLKLRDENHKMPAGAFLLSPWTDMLAAGESYYAQYGNDIEMGEKKQILTKEKHKQLLESDIYCVLENGSDRKNSYISPAYGDYHDFPPMIFNVGEYEMLLDDSLTIVKNLQKNGIPVICDVKPKMFHTYTLYGNSMKESRESLGEIIDFVKQQWKML